MHTYYVDGRAVHGACLLGKDQQEQFLAEEWPFDDLTVFIVREELGSPRELITGLPKFARWFKRRMESGTGGTLGPTIWFMACQPNDEHERDVIAANWLDEIDNSMK